MMQRFYSALALLAIIATWTSCSEALSIYNQATVRPGNGKFGSISVNECTCYNDGTYYSSISNDSCNSFTKTTDHGKETVKCPLDTRFSAKWCDCLYFWLVDCPSSCQQSTISSAAEALPTTTTPVTTSTAATASTTEKTTTSTQTTTAATVTTEIAPPSKFNYIVVDDCTCFKNNKYYSPVTDEKCEGYIETSADSLQGRYIKCPKGKKFSVMKCSCSILWHVCPNTCVPSAGAYLPLELNDASQSQNQSIAAAGMPMGYPTSYSHIQVTRCTCFKEGKYYSPVTASTIDGCDTYTEHTSLTAPGKLMRCPAWEKFTLMRCSCHRLWHECPDKCNKPAIATTTLSLSTSMSQQLATSSSQTDQGQERTTSYSLL